MMFLTKGCFLCFILLLQHVLLVLMLQDEPATLEPRLVLPAVVLVNAEE